MKIEAGWKLNRRNANVAPASTAASTPMEANPVASEMTAKVSAEMPQTPAASPSRPSMKFTMLMIIAIQKPVTSREAASGRCHVIPVNGTPMRVMRVSKYTATPIASNWPMNLTTGSSS